MQKNRAGPKLENSYQKLNVPREQQQQQQSNPSHDHAAKAAGKNNRKGTYSENKNYYYYYCQIGLVVWIERPFLIV